MSFFTHCAPCSPMISDISYTEYSSVSTMSTTTAYSTITRISTYKEMRLTFRLIPFRGVGTNAREAAIRIFGDVELAVLKATRN
jgi:hypothetical protein